jgi:hypothetical protein
MRKSSAGLLLLLIIALMAVMGARFAQKDEPVGAAESETVTQAPAQQVESKLENADAARDTEPQTVKEPEGSQVNEPDWKREAEYIAKAVYGEAGICCTTEQAAVVWCILNRVDSTDPYYPDDIIAVITQTGQFHGYKAEQPVEPELYELALDVIGRWQREKDGEPDTGRVLPADYLFFSGDGIRNYFRKDWRGGTTWDWSLPSPYED